MREDPPRTDAAARPSTGWVLLIDDDPDIRQAIQWLLEDEGFVVRCAADGYQALERADEARPGLVLLDLGLPRLSGEEVARQLHARFDAPPPIVVMTANGRAAEKAVQLGAVAYLHKPFDLEDLVEMVRRFLEPARSC